jgi:lipopolysaccharide transport system permease protein
MVGVIDGFRWCLLRGIVGVTKTMPAADAGLWWPCVLTSACVTAILCISGIWYFRKMERTFADII